jgi:hypothetical protein
MSAGYCALQPLVFDPLPNQPSSADLIGGFSARLFEHSEFSCAANRIEQRRGFRRNGLAGRPSFW